MERTYRDNDIVLLLDDYSKASEQLHTTFKLSGNHPMTIVIDGDGFTPEDVICVYDEYLKVDSEVEGGRPRYFNQIEIPDYWEINSNNSSGNVYDCDKLKARIYYVEPKNKRLVKIVEWLDNSGTVRTSDHYNKYGRIYARTTFNSKGERVAKSYFSTDNKEVIVENYVTSNVILNYNNVTKVFKNKTELVANYLVEKGMENSRLFFNSLSYPFFVSQIMPSKHKKDILFWQENPRNDIPGNMKLILEHRANRTEVVMVQNKSSYEKLIELGASINIVKLFGCVYPYVKENNYTNNALICTNSDQIEKLNELVEALPNIHFHIAALTEMSSKLMEMEKNSNVTLYPASDTATIDDLFMRCDIYLDINKYDEIVDAVRNAFLHNHVIFAFNETKHNINYTAKTNIFNADNWGQLVEAIQRVLTNSVETDEMISIQKSYATDVSADIVAQIFI